jgi:uncharacterized protein
MIASEKDLLSQIEAWVRERLLQHGAVAHGWLHVDRVRRNARALAPREGVPTWLAECAALLHDVGRTVPGPESEHGQRSAELAAPLLAELPVTDADRVELLQAVRWHNSARDDTRLLVVLRDADMLDGLGAIGLMRAFTSKADLPPYDERGVMLGGHFLRPPRSIADQVHFQIAWIDWLNTEAAREMAREQVAFMRAFVEQWQRELR